MKKSVLSPAVLVRMRAGGFIRTAPSAAPHTTHTSLIVVERGVFLEVSGSFPPPHLVILTLTLYSSSFNISFILPRKRYCGT
jgi:hypothetical protein